MTSQKTEIKPIKKRMIKAVLFRKEDNETITLSRNNPKLSNSSAPTQVHFEKGIMGMVHGGVMNQTVDELVAEWTSEDFGNGGEVGPLKLLKATFEKIEIEEVIYE